MFSYKLHNTLCVYWGKQREGVDRKPSFICNSLLNLVFSGVMLARKKYLIFPPLFL